MIQSHGCEMRQPQSTSCNIVFHQELSSLIQNVQPFKNLPLGLMSGELYLRFYRQQVGLGGLTHSLINKMQ